MVFPVDIYNLLHMTLAEDFKAMVTKLNKEVNLLLLMNVDQ